MHLYIYRSIHALGPSLSRTLPLHLITHTLFISLSLSLSLSLYPTRPHTHSLTASLTHSLTASLTHSSTHSLIHSLTHCITHSLHHSLTRSLHHALTQSLHHSFTHCITHPITASLSHSLIPPVMHCQRLLKTSMPICKFPADIQSETSISPNMGPTSIHTSACWHAPYVHVSPYYRVYEHSHVNTSPYVVTHRFEFILAFTLYVP